MKALDAAKRIIKIKPIVISICIIGALIVGYFGYQYVSSHQKEGMVSTISESSLEKVIEISELPTIEYTYNSVAKKEDSNGNVLYYVAYKGFVTAGIEFSKIDPEVVNDEENPQVIIHLPEATIQDWRVDMGSMEYIFQNERAKTETVSQEAYKLCKADLKNRIDSENELFVMAKENAQAAVKGLYEPWIHQLYPEYTIVMD